MDERQLAELFRDAADGGPPASFRHADVVAASHRATARRRMATAGGTALGVAVLVGGIVVGGGLQDAGRDGTTQGSTAGEVAVPSAPGDQQGGGTPGELAAPPSAAAADQNVPEANAEQGRTASGKVVPWPGLRDDDARAGCGPVDRELASVLLSEFPATPNVEPQGVPDGCPADARAAALPVNGGSIYLVLAPVRGDGPADQAMPRGDGAAGYFVYTPKGNGLLVLSVPAAAGGPAPYAERVQIVAEKIAQRY